MVACCIGLLALAATPDLTSLQRRIELDVTLGFETRQKILEGALSEVDSSLRTEVTALVDQAFRRHAAAQKQWKGRTDCDRLTAALTALSRKGIATREYFGMTTSSGHGELQEVLAKDRRLRGYVFYTPQDLETVLEDGGLWLTPGTREGPPFDALVKEVSAALEKEGLAPEWNGVSKIWLPLKWKKRR